MISAHEFEDAYIDMFDVYFNLLLKVEKGIVLSTSPNVTIKETENRRENRE